MFLGNSITDVLLCSNCRPRGLFLSTPLWFERSQNIVLNIKSGAINATAIFYPAFSLTFADDTGKEMSSLLQETSGCCFDEKP